MLTKAPISPLYFVEADFGRDGASFVETCRDKSSRRQVIRDIVEGQVENVLRILEVFEDESTCRDVTEDIARSVSDYLSSEHNGVPEHLRDWLDQWLGAGTADRLSALAGCPEDVYQREAV